MNHNTKLRPVIAQLQETAQMVCQSEKVFLLTYEILLSRLLEKEGLDLQVYTQAMMCIESINKRQIEIKQQELDKRIMKESYKNSEN